MPATIKITEIVKLNQEIAGSALAFDVGVGPGDTVQFWGVKVEIDDPENVSVIIEIDLSIVTEVSEDAEAAKLKAMGSLVAFGHDLSEAAQQIVDSPARS